MSFRAKRSGYSDILFEPLRSLLHRGAKRSVTRAPPSIAPSGRKVMLPLASAGFHVIAPDQRGYGRTAGWYAAYDGDLGSFRLLKYRQGHARLVSALGYRSVAAVVRHDFGSPVAAWCALA